MDNKDGIEYILNEDSWNNSVHGNSSYNSNYKNTKASNYKRINNRNLNTFNNRKNIYIEDSLLSFISNVFKHINKSKANNILKKCLSENLSTLEVLNCLFIENQISSHIKFFNFMSKVANYKREFFEIKNGYSENSHDKIIFEYKIHPFKDEEEYNVLNYKSLEEKRRKLFRDKKDYLNYIPIICDYKESCFNQDRCVYSHTENEINYHFLKYKTKFCKKKGCQDVYCYEAHSYKDFRTLYDLENNENLLQLKSLLETIDLFETINDEDDMYQILPSEFNLETYKTLRCPFERNCPLKYEILCLNYHSFKDRRRNIKRFSYGEAQCRYLKGDDGKYKDPKFCLNGDKCGYFHSKFEEYYHASNFRKTLCTNEDCKWIVVCPYIHKNNIVKDNKNYSSSIIKFYTSYIIEVRNQYKSLSKDIKRELKDHICIICEQILSTYNVIECGHIMCDECINNEESCICSDIKLNKIFSLKLNIN